MIKKSLFAPQLPAAICAAVCLSLGISLLEAKVNRPANIGSGLDRVCDLYQKNPAGFHEAAKAYPWFITDDQDRVVANIYLDGSVPLSKIKEAATSLGCSSIADLADYRSGVVSVFLPASRIQAIATMAGVRSVILSPRPTNNVGSTTAQGAAVHHTLQVNKLGELTRNGISGTGISIGLMSDSFNAAKGVSTAADGVASGDLPGTGNADNPQPITVVKEIPFPYTLVATDEGRGMCELAHDLAPKAKLSFATAYPSEVAFANNIRSLRTDSRTRCDVICDDVGYATEPMFSDGIIAQAVDDVATSTTLPGKKVAYFSSAGNAGSSGYASTFSAVTPQQAQKLKNQNLKLKDVPKSLYAGGFHDFDPSSNVDISQTITPSGAATSACFQWDDAFDKTNGITTDFNILVFDAAGNFLPDSSLVADNFATNQPVEYPLTLKADTTYQIVIARTNAGRKIATRFRYVERAATLAGEYLTTDGPTTYGHNSAAGGNGVAAYVYDGNPSAAGFVPAIEGFTSNGPVIINFDAQGNRLPQAVTRLKPDFAAADGQNTSFFPKGDITLTDYDGDGFPNFFGTSASAPTAGAIAALVIEAAGGPGSVSPEQVKTVLKTSVSGVRDIDPRFCRATVTNGSIIAKITANGDDPFDPNFFQVTFGTQGTESLASLEIDVTPSGIEFDPDLETGFPFTIGAISGIAPSAVSTTLTEPTSSGGFQNLLVGFANSDFNSTDSINFGLDRDIANVGNSGNSADLLAGSTVHFRIPGVGTLDGTFQNQLGSGYNYADGTGFIDALKACQTVLNQ